MNALVSFVKHHSLIVFVLLSYLLSWLVVIPSSGLLLPWGPTLAALVVLGVTEGRSGLKAWWDRAVSGSRPAWLAAAVAIPIGLNLTAAVLNRLLGAQLAQPVDWSLPFRALPFLLLVSGMWEEPGWTAYALPHLLQRFSRQLNGALVATLVMGAIRTGWHLPLMLYGHIYWSDLVFIMAFQVALTWLYRSSRNSLAVVMLCHLVNNAVIGEFVQHLFSGADWIRYYWLFALLWSGLAVIVLGLSGLQGKRRRAATEAVPTHQTAA